MLFHLLSIALVTGGLAYIGLLTPLGALYTVLGGLAVSAAASCGGLIIDVLKPNVKWTDPQKAMKGNANGLFSLIGMLVLLAVGALVTFLAFLLPKTMTVPAVILVFAALALGLAKTAGTLANRRYLEYED